MRASVHARGRSLEAALPLVSRASGCEWQAPGCRRAETTHACSSSCWIWAGPATYVDGEADGLVPRHVAAVHRAAHSSMMSSEFTAQFAPSGSEKQCGRESWPDRVNRAGIERVHQRFRKKLGSAVTSRSAQRRGPPLATRICCCRTRRPRTG